MNNKKLKIQMSNVKTKRSGQVLIEIILTLALGSILLGVIVTSMVEAARSNLLNLRRTEGNFLAEEQTEALRQVREQGWSNIKTNGTYHLDKSTGTWKLLGGGETVNDYQREITIEDYQSGGQNHPSVKKITAKSSFSSPILLTLAQFSLSTRFLNNNVQLDSTATQFNAGTKTDVEVTNVAGGEVKLATGVGAGGFFGNQFLVDSASGLGGRLNNANLKASMRFTSQQNINVTTVWVNIFERFNPPTYRFSIQTNSGGNPSGTILASGTSSPAGIGWRSVTLSSTANLVAGNTYHIVVEYASGRISGRNYIALRQTKPQNLLIPKTQNPDSQSNTLFFNGTSWAAQNAQPLYRLDGGGLIEGNPYDQLTIQNIFGLNFWGEQIKITGSDKIATAIEFQVKKNVNQNPAGNLLVTLKDIDTNTTIEQGALSTPTQVSTAFQWLKYTFTQPRALSLNKNYAIFLSSPTSLSNRFYQVRNITVSSAGFESITFEGIDSITISSTDAGSNFIPNSQADIGGFRFTLEGGTGFVPLGTFESATFDATLGVGFNRIESQASNIISGTTDLKLQISTNNDNASWNYVGPDGTAATFFTGTSLPSIPLSYVEARYFRYKAFLSTNNANQSPILEEIRINFSP